MAWLCAIVATTLALAAPSSEELERGKSAFGRAEYARAINILRPLLYPDIRLDSESDVVQVHRMLGVAHLFEKQPDDARREFRRLLELRPEYRFDSLTDPARVVEFFNGVVKEEESEIAALASARKKRDQELAGRVQREADERCAARVRTITVAKNSYPPNFIPFGWGQFQNGQRGKAWAFLGTEVGLGAISVGALAVNFTVFGVNPRRRCLDPHVDNTSVPRPCVNIDRSEEDLSRNLTRVQVVSGVLFFAVAAWGVLDAIHNFKATIPLDGEPPADGDVESPPPKRADSRHPRPSASLSGWGLQWSF
jgi:hypothetical protein